MLRRFSVNIAAAALSLAVIWSVSPALTVQATPSIPIPPPVSVSTLHGR
jgi:hypothetical protein